jgi:hypothetical protein
MHNPLSGRLTRQYHPWLAGATVLSALVLSTGGVNIALRAGQGSSPNDNLLVGMQVVGLLIALVSPFVAAAGSAAITARDTADESYALLKISMVKQSNVLQAHLYAALAGLWPLWVVCFGYLLPVGAARYADATAFRVGPVLMTHSEAIIHTMLIVICGAALGIAANWFAVCIGVCSGLKASGPTKAVVVSLGVVLLATAAAYMACPIALMLAPFLSGFSVLVVIGAAAALTFAGWKILFSTAWT